MSNKKCNHSWLQRHCSDTYVKRAQKEGFRARSAYKLLEIQEKTRLIHPGMRIIELGAAPGSWSQLISRLLKSNGKLYTIDSLPMQPIASVFFMQGDFTQESTRHALKAEINAPVDLVLSDIAPNLSGIAAVDQPRTLHLAELALEFSKEMLKSNGHFLIKIFQGSGSDLYIKQVRQLFKQINIYKPTASRAQSSEVYLLAQNYLK